MAALHARCFTTPRPWSEAEFAGLLGQAGVFAATLPGGFALGRALAGEAELLTIAVAPEARRAGLGLRLMAEFAAAARARDAETAFLEVAAGNEAARALYARAGFTEAGRRRGYYHHPDGRREDALILTLPLPRQIAPENQASA